MAYPKINENEKRQIEEVFSLGGGELSDAPMRIAVMQRNPLYGARHNEKPIEFRRWWVRYFYDGAPEYVAREMERKGGSYVTIVRDFLFGPPPKRFVKGGKIYRLVALYRSSGEAECPGRTLHECLGSEDHPTKPDEHGRLVSIVTEEEAARDESKKDCPYCGESIGEGHGYIYLGDGWAEAVYRTRD